MVPSPTSPSPEPLLTGSKTGVVVTVTLVTLVMMPLTKLTGGSCDRRPVDELVGVLTARGIELRAEGGRLRFRPRAAMTPDLAERVKRHKPELLAMLAGGPEPVADDRPETHADREWRRFLAVARPWPDGRGWYDPRELERFRRRPTAASLVLRDS